MKYKIWDKVVIVSDKKCNWARNEKGLMDKWLWKTMTIYYINDYWYKMEEDKEEHNWSWWVWGDDMIEWLIEEHKSKKVKSESKKVTLKEVEKNMQEVETKTIKFFWKRMTITSVKMLNGFLVTETSKPIDDAIYDEALWEATNLESIKEQIWMFLGYSKH